MHSSLFLNPNCSGLTNKKYNIFITMIICRNYMILLIIQHQCYYTTRKSFWNRRLQSFVISKVIYYSTLLGSNKSRMARIQTLINTGLFWVNLFGTNSNNNLTLEY